MSLLYTFLPHYNFQESFQFHKIFYAKTHSAVCLRATGFVLNTYCLTLLVVFNLLNRWTSPEYRNDGVTVFVENRKCSEHNVSLRKQSIFLFFVITQHFVLFIALFYKKLWQKINSHHYQLARIIVSTFYPVDCQDCPLRTRWIRNAIT